MRLRREKVVVRAFTVEVEVDNTQRPNDDDDDDDIISSSSSYSFFFLSPRVAFLEREWIEISQISLYLS